MRVLTIVGARPQFIKASALSKAFTSLGITELLLDSGQHYDDAMSDAFFRELGLPRPAVSLAVGSGSHGQMTAKILEGCESFLIKERPDIVVVYGDTNTTLAGALAAAKLSIPVAHVESGLRSFNSTMPEEINRRLTDHCSTLLFCPTRTAINQLNREGVGSNIKYNKLPSLQDITDRPEFCMSGTFYVGDIMIDSLHWIQKNNRKNPPTLSLPDGEYGLLTLHRAANTDSDKCLKYIISQIKDVSQALKIVFPVHPRTKSALKRIGVLDELANYRNFKLMDPLSYGDFVFLQSNAKVVITDSGGVQKEAAILGVPCITIRDETEWPETIDAGLNKLVGSFPKDLRDTVANINVAKNTQLDCFGDGRAADRIALIIDRWWNDNRDR